MPLLAPFYYLLAVFLKERPQYFNDLLVLSAWGVVMGAVMWFNGPWAELPSIPVRLPGAQLKLSILLLLQGAALLSWLGLRWKSALKFKNGFS